MTHLSRREMLRDVGRGMFVAGIGAALTADLGLGRIRADDATDRLKFGDLDPLVDFICSTPPDKLLPAAVKKLANGVDLKQLTAATALANARAFGGEDYVGFHTLMALAPAYHMSAEEADSKLRPLAVLKVLFRNASRFKEADAGEKHTLKPVAVSTDKNLTGAGLRDAVRKVDTAAAEKSFAAMCKADPTGAINPLMEMVDDATEVHRIVLVSKSWELLDFVGQTNTHTLLRQSVRYCLKSEAYPNHVSRFKDVREILPKMLDQHKLVGKKFGTRTLDDAALEKLTDAIFGGSPADAAGAVATALADGFAPDAIGEALALAANQLVLRDEGRPKEWAQANKPVGSCHGDSVGVHGCDSIHAWGTIARLGDSRTTASSLILGAYQVAWDRSSRAEFTKWQPYPRGEHSEKVKDVPADKLLTELETAIKANDQGRAAALTARLGTVDKSEPAAVFGVLRRYAVSEDGALHAEKFYRTVTEEFARTRAALRWRHLTALARVTASAYGQPAPGVADARKLLVG